MEHSCREVGAEVQSFLTPMENSCGKVGGEVQFVFNSDGNVLLGK